MLFLKKKKPINFIKFNIKITNNNNLCQDRLGLQLKE